MSLEYYTILTNKGVEYETDCISTSSEFHLTHIAVGDGGGNDTTPNKNQTSLINEVRRYSIQAEELDIENGLYYAKIEIPPTDGGFTIRELGGYNSNGDLVMVANFPATVKRTQDSGEYKRMFVRMDLSIVNSQTFPSVINPNLSYYDSTYIDNLDRGNVKLTGNQTVNGIKTFKNKIVGNIDSADKLKTSRTISLSGAITGSGSFDGSEELDIVTTGKSKTISLSGAVTGSATLNTGNNSSVTITTTLTNSAKVALLQQIYPVGAMYIGMTSTCPLSALFGTWQLITGGLTLQQANVAYPVGTEIPAGIPNIYGQVTKRAQSDTATDALYVGKNGASRYKYEDGTGKKIMLDASRVSSVYRDVDTVQPPALAVNIWRRVA